MKKNLLLVLALTVGAAALALLGSGCETIPDESGGLSVSVDFAFPPGLEAGGEMGAAIIPPPKTLMYHVKITLTNPKETFYIFDYPVDEMGYGAAVHLQVAAGGTRIIDAEAYEVPPYPPSPNYFPASHIVTDPIESSESMRTIDMTAGTTRSLTLDMIYDSNYGSIGGGADTLVFDGNTYGPIDFARSCPPPDEFYADIVDLDWGGYKLFPTVPLELQGGTYNNLKLYDLPQGHKFGLEVYHLTSGLHSHVQANIPVYNLTSSLSTHEQAYTSGGPFPISLKLGGYSPPYVFIDPARVDMNYGDSDSVYWEVLGGWGGTSFLPPTLGPADTCYGSLFGDIYSFSAPSSPNCTINIQASDCREIPVPVPAEGFASVYVSPVCGNDMCEDFLGENNTNCPADCYCGDGNCLPPEDDVNCSADCNVD
jgi:hypothetical protein